MSTLAEIESATESLLPEQKEELFLYLVERLRAERGQLPMPRNFSRQEMDSWVAEDEADMQRFQMGA